MTNKAKTKVIFAFIDMAAHAIGDDQDHFKKLIGVNMSKRSGVLLFFRWLGIVFAFATFGIGWYNGQLWSQALGTFLVGWNFWDEWKAHLIRQKQDAYLHRIFELVMGFDHKVSPSIVRQDYLRLMEFVLSQPPAYI